VAALSDAALELTAEELAAVARLWRATRREVDCRFGGTSMAPTLASGAEVRLRCGEGGAAGDIIAFLDQGRVLLHRVVAASADRAWILTRGDARLLPDAPIRRAEDVIGRVTAVRDGGTFVPPPAPPRATALQRAVLWPLLASLRVGAGPGTALVRSLVRARRLARRLSAAWRPRSKP
jgi:hypothetical protein